jgi:DGQHR domain-containing protein
MEVLRFPALAYPQGPSRTLYTFVAESQSLDSVTMVSRIARPEDGTVEGYQRPEVSNHISSIKNYLLSEQPMLPNALVVAFNQEVTFEEDKGDYEGNPSIRRGNLVVPFDPNAPAQKPGWIVDGQQRMAALKEANRESFFVCIVAFIAKRQEEQREQFILVNATKPLPKGLIYELLPQTDCVLPVSFQKRRFPAYLMEQLNRQPDSPFYRKIKSQTNPAGVIQDNSVLRMIENSLADGALYKFSEGYQGRADPQAMLQVLKNYWRAVSNTFGKAWELSPKQSRLTHGAGIVSMGYVMDTIADKLRDRAIPTPEAFQKDLLALAPVCRWTHGFWELGPGAQRKWNEIQNTATDIRMLTQYLIFQYKSLVWNPAFRQ